MDSNFYSLLIGFNEYKDKDNLANLRFAEKDAHDFYNLLIDPKIGGYSQSNIVSLTGKDVTTEQIEEKLNQYVVKDRTSDDIVVVFFSGHGFIAGDDERAYLATPDVTVLDILKNPRKGLQMEFIFNDIFLASKARSVIFFLDACHSGAFIPGLRKDRGDQKEPSRINKDLIKEAYFIGEGRVAFVSSPKGINSRESTDLKNGIFTYHLLNGLRGMAIEPYTGEVTLSSLIPYVQALTPANQPPVRYGKDTGRIILTKPNNVFSKRTSRVSKINIQAVHINQEARNERQLRNPLTNEMEYVDKFLTSLKVTAETNRPIDARILSAMTSSLQAETAFIVRIDSQGNIFPKGFEHSAKKRDNEESITTALLMNISNIINLTKKDLLPFRFGLFKPQKNNKGESSSKFVVIIPLRLDHPKEFLILGGVSSENLRYGEIIGHALASTYHATNELSSIDLLKIEANILDNLRTVYGYLPYEVFQRRQKTFTEKLNTIVYHFEPIVNLGKDIEIDSWEALARDPTTDKAPGDLFRAAELWGSEFVKALDLYCIRNAVATYTTTWKKENRGKKIDPLAVNIYPETVFFDDYLDEARKIIKDEGLIKGARVIFEISEKRPIPKLSDKDQLGRDEVDDFTKRIKSISEELNVGFAIDDFGVGHASVSRLARLKLAHVKIDREILYHEHPEKTISYVLSLVHQSHANPVKVIVEGFDGAAHISLNTLYKKLNIEYIQGHLIRRASSSLRYLSSAKVNYLQKILLEADD